MEFVLARVISEIHCLILLVLAKLYCNKISSSSCFIFSLLLFKDFAEAQIKLMVVLITQPTRTTGRKKLSRRYIDLAAQKILHS